MTTSLREALADGIEGYKTGLAGGPMGFVSAAFDIGWTHGAQDRRCLEAGPVETPSVHQGSAVAGAVQRPAGKE